MTMDRILGTVLVEMLLVLEAVLLVLEAVVLVLRVVLVLGMLLTSTPSKLTTNTMPSELQDINL